MFVIDVFSGSRSMPSSWEVEYMWDDNHTTTVEAAETGHERHEDINRLQETNLCERDADCWC